MVSNPDETLRRILSSSQRYPEDAYFFVRDGLSFAVEQTHGPLSESQEKVYEYMLKNGLDPQEIADHLAEDTLPEEIKEAIHESGGMDRMNRHVSGQNLAWALRDLALKRWGRLALLVLDRWNIRQTLDFGRIVFALIEHDFMQKEPADSLDDFRDVYDFATAFDHVLQPISDEED